MPKPPLDPMKDPVFRRWASDQRANLLPVIADSAMSAILVPEDARLSDIKIAVELGLSILLDKPIIVVTRPGIEAPDHLIRCADHVVEWTPGMDNDDLMAAIDAVLGKDDE